MTVTQPNDEQTDHHSGQSRAPRTVLVSAAVAGDADQGWLAGVASALATPGEYVTCAIHDLGGHELALLDFDPETVERFRRLGGLIEIPHAPDVRSALAISGSAAQARVHPYPADADFFERVHLASPDRAAAASRLADLIRGNALATAAAAELRLVEVHFGHHPGAYGSIRWSPPEVRSGIAVRASGAAEVPITWDEAAADPGFVKLDWLLVDPALGGPRKVSKVVDATWERRDGTIESLDGLIDGDFQQIYLSAEDALIASRLVEHAGPDRGRAAYVRFMEQEIAKYLRQTPPDYVKIAKRLYNRCRLTGHYAEALWLRELFDEPPARLVQVRARLELIAADCDHDPVVAEHRLRRLLAEDEEVARIVLGGPDPIGRDDLAAGDVAAAVARLDAALGATIAEQFGRRLLASSAVASLLDAIEGGASA